MLTHAARAVPWPRVVVASLVVVVLLELVRWNPWTLWPLEGTAVGLLAGAAAWCFDEQAAVVVDVTPRGLAWRTSARLTGVLVLTVTWCAVVVHARDALFDEAPAVLTQGLVAIVLGTSWATWRRSRGEAMPGLAAATVTVPLATAWALARPFEHELPVFPYGYAGLESDWRLSTTGWCIAAVVAALALAGALTDARWWRAGISRRPGPSRGAPRGVDGAQRLPA